MLVILSYKGGRSFAKNKYKKFFKNIIDTNYKNNLYSNMWEMIKIKLNRLKKSDRKFTQNPREYFPEFKLTIFKKSIINSWFASRVTWGSRVKKRGILLSFAVRNKKSAFTLYNFGPYPNKFFTVGVLLKSLGISQKRERRTLKNKKIFVKFVSKKLNIQKNLPTYIYVKTFDRQLLLSLRRSKFVKKLKSLNTNHLIIDNESQYGLQNNKKLRRIKKRIKKRIISYESKVRPFPQKNSR